MDLQLSISSSEIIFNRAPPLATSHSSTPPPHPKQQGWGQRGRTWTRQMSGKRSKAIYRAAIRGDFLCFWGRGHGKAILFPLYMLLLWLWAHGQWLKAQRLLPTPDPDHPPKKDMQAGRYLNKIEHRKLGSLQLDEWCSPGWKEKRQIKPTRPPAPYFSLVPSHPLQTSQNPSMEVTENSNKQFIYLHAYQFGFRKHLLIFIL